MDSIPNELLELKARLDHWRATSRKHLRQPLPTDLRQEVIAISRRYPGTLLRRVLNIDPWRLNRSTAKKPKPSATRKKELTTFFKLPTGAVSPSPTEASISATDCRLQFERPDGARITLTLPGLDASIINSLVADFLRGGRL